MSTDGDGPLLLTIADSAKFEGSELAVDSAVFGLEIATARGRIVPFSYVKQVESEFSTPPVSEAL